MNSWWTATIGHCPLQRSVTIDAHTPVYLYMSIYIYICTSYRHAITITRYLWRHLVFVFLAPFSLEWNRLLPQGTLDTSLMRLSASALPRFNPRILLLYWYYQIGFFFFFDDLILNIIARQNVMMNIFLQISHISFRDHIHMYNLPQDE